MRQAPINFPFKFVFNRDLVSHAIYITDLNTKYYRYYDSKLLVPVIRFAELVKTSLFAIWTK